MKTRSRFGATSKWNCCVSDNNSSSPSTSRAHVQDLIARISDDLNEIKEEIQDEDPGKLRRVACCVALSEIRVLVRTSAGPMLNKKLQKAAKYTASLQFVSRMLLIVCTQMLNSVCVGRYHVKLLEELQDDGSQRTLRHDDVLPLELVMEFEEDYIADGDADLPETDAIAEPVRRRSRWDPRPASCAMLGRVLVLLTDTMNCGLVPSVKNLSE